MYTHKWTLKIADANDEPTREYLVWYEALSGKTVEDITRGFKALEAKVAKDFETGKESWPPSYAEFSSLCKPYIYDRDKPKALGHEISDEEREANLVKIQAIMKELKS